MDGALDGRRYEELCEMLAADGVNLNHALPLFRWLQRDIEKAARPPLMPWIEAWQGGLADKGGAGGGDA